jgi:hypothetical protein
MKTLFQIVEVIIANFRGNVNEVLLRQAKESNLVSDLVGSQYIK